MDFANKRIRPNPSACDKCRDVNAFLEKVIPFVLLKTRKEMDRFLCLFAKCKYTIYLLISV